METNNLPKDKLEFYGIMNPDKSFSKRMSEKEIADFLTGGVLVVDKGRDRLTFQLTENNSQLKVNVFERNKSLTQLKENIQTEKVHFVNEKNIFSKPNELDTAKIMLIVDKNKMQEIDILKNPAEATKVVFELNDEKVANRYKSELLKLKGMLQDKIDQFPEVAKEITVNLNIVSKEINSVNSAYDLDYKKAEQTMVRLDVNDPDLYQDANRQREEDLEEEYERQRGMRR